MCGPICAAPQDTTMTCDDCKMGIQAAIDQLLEPTSSTQSWVRSRQQSARATPLSSAPPPWMVSSGRDFPCWLLLEMIPALHRLVMPPWKALAQRENSGFSEGELTGETDFNKFLVDLKFYFVNKQS